MKNIITNRREYGVFALTAGLAAGVIAIWLVGGAISANTAMAQVPSPCTDSPELCKDLQLGGKLPSQVDLNTDVISGLNNRFFQFLGNVFDGVKFAAGVIFDGLKYAYEGFSDYFFSRTPLPIAPIDLNSVPSSPDQTQSPTQSPAPNYIAPAPGTITKACYSEAAATLKYSECGKTFQSKKDAVLYSDSAATLIPIYAKEYDACTNAVYANKCR